MCRNSEPTQPLRVACFLKEDPTPYRERLADGDGVCFRFFATDAALAEGIVDADVLLASAVPSTATLSLARRLRWIQAAAAGVDGFLGAGWPPAGALLTRIPSGFGEAIAEYVIAHVLAVTQGLRRIRDAQAARSWSPFHPQLVAGKVMGVAGTGEIGRVVAQRARGVGMRTLGLARTGRKMAEFERVFDGSETSEFLGGLDVLAICLPLTPGTRGFFGAAELASMKRGAILVNVARGAIVDEAALVDALRAGTIRAAVLDVFETEPLPDRSPLWEMENVTVTPHVAGLNDPDQIVGVFLDNLRRFRDGASLHGVVDPQRGY